MSPIAAAGAGALGVGPPRRLLLSVALDRVGQPVLRILGLHHADVAEDAGLHHLARLPDHRVAGVVVGQHEDLAALLDQRGELLGVGQRRGQRLVADDVDAGLEEGLRRRIMHVVRRDDRHRLDAVGPRRLGPRHLRVVDVGAVGLEAELRARGAGALGVGRSAPATSSYWSSIRAARRCTAPMKAPCPPPTMPNLMRPPAPAPSARPSIVTTHLRARASVAPSPRPSRRRRSRRTPCSVTWIRQRSMNGAPSAAPCAGLFRQHSHSSTAHEP